MSESTTNADVKKAAKETEVIRRDNIVKRGVATYHGNKYGDGAAQNAAKAIKDRKAMLDEI